MRVPAPIALVCLMASSCPGENSSLPSALNGVDWKKVAIAVSNDSEFQNAVRDVFGSLTVEKQQVVTSSIGRMRGGRGYEIPESPVDVIVAKALAEKLAPVIADEGAKNELRQISSKGDIAALLSVLNGDEPGQESDSGLSDGLNGYFHSPLGNGSGCFAFYIDGEGVLSGVYFDGNPVSYTLVQGKKPGRRADASFTCGYTGQLTELRITPDRDDGFRVEQENDQRKESYVIRRVSPENQKQVFEKAKRGPLSKEMREVLERLDSIQ